MNLHERDKSVLEHIISYCDEIDETVQRFGDDNEKFLTDKIYRNAAAMCILQIGELVGVLTDDFKNNYKKAPWKQIKDMRNIVAHRYGTVNADTTWEIIKNDIPELKQYCEQILSENDISDNAETKENM